MKVNSKTSLIKLLETCRDSHKPYAKKNRRHNRISAMSPAWNTRVIKEYQEAIDFIKNKLRRV